MSAILRVSQILGWPEIKTSLPQDFLFKRVFLILVAAVTVLVVLLNDIPRKILEQNSGRLSTQYMSRAIALSSRQKCLRVRVCDKIISTLRHLSQRWNVASLSLLYRNFYGKYSDELYSLVPPVLFFTASTRHVTLIVAIHTRYFHSSLVRSFTWAASPREPLLCGTESEYDIFFDHYKINLFK